jgi:hypothetical protein
MRRPVHFSLFSEPEMLVRRTRRHQPDRLDLIRQRWAFRCRARGRSRWSTYAYASERTRASRRPKMGAV